MKKVVTYSSAGFVTNPAVNGYNIIFAGTGPGVYSGDVPTLVFSDGANHTLNSIIETGHSAQALSYGVAEFSYPLAGNATIAHGIHLSYGNLELGSANGGTWTIDGSSMITNDSVFTSWGGRYHADPLVINGRMTVSHGSTADFSSAPVQGSGTIDIESGGTVTVDRIAAGLHIDVGRGGRLVTGTYSKMAFLGTIHETASGVVDVPNAKTVTSELFDRSTGVLDLLDNSGALVDRLKFSGARMLFTTPDGHGGMDIMTAHHAGSLPVFFAHHGLI
jgi:hypothetical protein